MVNVSSKPSSERSASAAGNLLMDATTVEAIQGGTTAKGDPLVVARIAGTMAAKRTSDLIPLCHPLPLTGIDVQLDVDASLPGIRARATASVVDRTGVEMEALTAVSVALLTAYDMLKAIDRGMRIDNVRLLRKSGGRSGTWEENDPDWDADGTTPSASPEPD